MTEILVWQVLGQLDNMMDEQLNIWVIILTMNSNYERTMKSSYELTLNSDYERSDE
jgi:hypothetical protein